MKKSFYKVTVQTLTANRKKRNRTIIFIHCLSPFWNVRTRFAFFHLEGNLPKFKEFWKIFASGLHNVAKFYHANAESCRDHELLGQDFWLSYIYIICMYIYIVVFLLKGDIEEKAAFGRQHIYFPKLRIFSKIKAVFQSTLMFTNFWYLFGVF